MGLPKGTNNGNVGKKGRSGRKSAYAEKADAEFLAKLFFERHSKEEIKKMLGKGKYSVSDVMLAKAFGGNERIVLSIFNKLFPDKKILAGDEKNPVRITGVEIRVRKKPVKKIKKK